MKKAVLPATIVCALVWDIGPVHAAAERLLPPGAIWVADSLNQLWTAFAIGIAAYIFRHRIPLSWWILVGLLVVNIAAQQIGAGLHLRVVLIGYAVLCLGFLTAKQVPVGGMARTTATACTSMPFPVMMIVSLVWRTHAYLGLSVATFFGTLPFAALSWHFIEKPALDAFRRSRRKQAPAPAV